MKIFIIMVVAIFSIVFFVINSDCYQNPNSLTETSDRGLSIRPNSTSRKLRQSRPAIKWAKEDSVVALEEALSKSNDFYSPTSEIDEVFRTWFLHDPVTALDAIRNLESEDLRLAALSNATTAFANDGGRLAELCAEILDQMDSQRKFLCACARRLSTSHPETIWTLLNQPMFESIRDEGIRSHFDSLAQDPVGWSASAVLSEVKRLDSSSEIDLAVRSYLSHNPKLNPSNYKLLLTLTDQEDVQVGAFVAISRQTLAHEGVEGLIRMTQTISIDDRTRRVAINEIVKDGGGHRLEDRLSKIKGSDFWRIGEDEGLIATAISAGVSLQAAKKFAEGIDPNSPSASDVFSTVSFQAVKRDANDAALWIGTLPPGEARNAALKHLLDYLRKHNEHESLKSWMTMVSP